MMKAIYLSSKCHVYRC